MTYKRRVHGLNPLVWPAVGLLLLAASAAWAGFSNVTNLPFNSRCNGPQGAIVVADRPGGMSAQAEDMAVATQDSPAMLRTAAARYRRLQQLGLASRRWQPRFPRIIVHTVNNKLVLPDLMHAAQTGGLGNPANNITFEYQGWSAADQTTLSNYLQAAVAKAKLIYGPPAFNTTVKIIQDSTIQAIQGGTYDVTTNEIRIPPLSDNFAEDSYVLLVLVLNAFHGNAVFYYDAWEQGFIGAAAYVIQTQPGVAPGYSPIDPGPFYCLSVYEAENHPQLGNSTFYPASGATNMLVWRIAMARAAWLKCYIENPQFFAQFNQLYYQNFTSTLPGDVPALKEIAAQVVPTVEGIPFMQWYEQQYVLDTSVRLGEKLFTWNIPLPDSVALITELYQTLPNGDESPMGGQASTVYWNYDFSSQLYAEEGNVISIPSGGSTPGEGFLLPTFYNIGGPQRVTVDIDIDGLEQSYPYPYGERGFELTENNLYGAVTGADQGTIDVQGGDGISGLAVTRGVWGSRITTAALTPMKITATFTNQLGQKMTRQFNIGWDSYVFFLNGGDQVNQSHTYAYGLNGLQMMSIPVMPVSQDASQVLGIPANQLLLAWWDPALGSDNKYRIWPSFPFRNPGYGYWLRVLQDTTVTLQGVQPDPTSDYTVPVSGGWNIIGSPRLDPVALTDLEVKQGDNDPVSWTDAVNNHLMQDGLYGYDQTAGYQLDDTLQPWEGYWVRCLSPTGVQLIFPGTTQSSSGVRAAANPTASQKLAWRLPLVVQAGPLRSASAYLGEADKASVGPDVYDLAAPPSFGQYAQVRFVHNDWQGEPADFMTDVRPQTDQRQQWNIQVTSSLSHTPVRLSWPDLSSLPADIKPVLYDPTTGTRQYMRTTTSYVIPAGDQGANRQLVIEAGGPTPTLTLTGVLAEQAKQGVTITYTLSADASVQATVVNIAGRPIRTLLTDNLEPAGQRTLVWNLRDRTGTMVPSGTYLVEVAARSDTGEQVHALSNLQVQR